MRIVEINAYAYGSTGKIMLQIAEMARTRGHEVITFSTNPFSVKGTEKKTTIKKHFYYGSFFENFIHFSLAQISDGNGMFSTFATMRLVNRIKKFRPDVIHLHNLHGFCISLPILFRYVAKNNIRIIWTFHDCWAFTGHCCHFDMIGCERWKVGCENCPQGKVAPKSRISRASQMWYLKNKWIHQVKSMTIVTPSEWLAHLVEESYLNNYPVEVIHNGIDLNTFSSRESDFRDKYDIRDKKIILGVAFGWGERKGLDVFLELYKRLDNKYQIVLVGTDENTDTLLPDGILSIHKTQNQSQLAEIYSAADVFVNPTREDTYPTVNMEAMACGTPVVTFATGGSPESVFENCGYVIEKNNVEAMLEKIKEICEDDSIKREVCMKQAEVFASDLSYEKYIQLFEMQGRKR